MGQIENKAHTGLTNPNNLTASHSRTCKFETENIQILFEPYIVKQTILPESIAQ